MGIEIWFIAAGYLSGSILFARLVSGLSKKGDFLQDSPDHNPGAANAFRYGGSGYRTCVSCILWVSGWKGDCGNIWLSFGTVSPARAGAYSCSNISFLLTDFMYYAAPPAYKNLIYNNFDLFCYTAPGSMDYRRFCYYFGLCLHTPAFE